MPVPNPGLKVDSDNQEVEFLMVIGALEYPGVSPKDTPGKDKYPGDSLGDTTRVFPGGLSRGDPPGRTWPLAAQLRIFLIVSFSQGSREGPLGETVHPQQTHEILSSGPENKLLGVFSHACAESGLKSRL